MIERRSAGTSQRRHAGAALVAALLVGCAPGATIPADWRHAAVPAPYVAPHAMVVSEHELASRAGAEMLRRGGNAVDGAVATGFALAAVQLSSGNIGGGGFLVLRLADGQVFALDYREMAPAAATPRMFLDSAGNVTDRSVLGALASGVPGSVAGMWEMHQRFGRLPWGDLIAPAIALAEAHVLDSAHARSLNGRSLSRFPSTRALFVRERPWQAGDTLRQPDLASTLRRIAQDGRNGFYAGRTAELIEAQMRESGGIITAADLAAYQPRWRAPLRTMYRGYEILTMPPVSGGGATLIQALNILEGFRLPAFGSREQRHLMIEAQRRAFEDRNRYLGDPDFVAVPIERLTSKAYAAGRRQSIDRGRATPTLQLPRLPEGAQTTHYSVADSMGNIAAVTTTLNTGYGSKLVVQGAGFFLNNEMDDFTTLPGTVNAMGIQHVGEANIIQPGKRMLSSMTPTIVLGPSGRPVLALGAEGGAHIISAVIQVISNVIDHGMSVTEAVYAPRIHHNALPDSVGHEPTSLPPRLRQALQRMGHAFEERPGFMGTIEAIGWTPRGLIGVSDPRSTKGVVGF